MLERPLASGERWWYGPSGPARSWLGKEGHKGPSSWSWQGPRGLSRGDIPLETPIPIPRKDLTCRFGISSIIFVIYFYHSPLQRSTGTSGVVEFLIGRSRHQPEFYSCGIIVLVEGWLYSAISFRFPESLWAHSSCHFSIKNRPFCFG